MPMNDTIMAMTQESASTFMGIARFTGYQQS